MYAYLVLSAGPNSSPVLSAGQLALMVAVPVLSLAVWLFLVFTADREPRRRGAAGTTPQPVQPHAEHQEREQPEHAAA